MFKGELHEEKQWRGSGGRIWDDFRFLLFQMEEGETVTMRGYLLRPRVILSYNYELNLVVFILRLWCDVLLNENKANKSNTSSMPW